MDLNDRFLSPASSRNSTNSIIRPGTTSTRRSQNDASHPRNSTRSSSSRLDGTPHTSSTRSRSNNSDFQTSNSERSNLYRSVGQEIVFTDDDDDSDNDKKLTNAVETRLAELRTLKNHHEGEITRLINEVDGLKQKMSNTQKLFQEFIRNMQVECPELFNDVDVVDGHIDS